MAGTTENTTEESSEKAVQLAQAAAAVQVKQGVQTDDA